jgi:membrane protein implicated in regulation of membrane protease activity
VRRIIVRMSAKGAQDLDLRADRMMSLLGRTGRVVGVITEGEGEVLVEFEVDDRPAALTGVPGEPPGEVDDDA